MSRSVAINFHCSCDTTATVAVSDAERAVWSCPRCRRRWRADVDSLSTALAGAAEIHTLRAYVVTFLGLAALAAVALAAMQPNLLLGLPIVVGGVALIARPTYRKRLQQAKTAIATPIKLAVMAPAQAAAVN